MVRITMGNPYSVGLKYAIMLQTKQNKEQTMANVFHIRLQAVLDNAEVDGDVQRLSRELSRLEIDLISAIRRCEAAGNESCDELHTLLDFVDNRLRGDASLLGSDKECA